MSLPTKPFYHSLHPLHPLSRTSFFDYDVLSCDVCDQELIFDRCYCCKPCRFVVCSKCVIAEVAQNDVAIALKEKLVTKFKHEGHNPQHTLTLKSRPAAFLCNACQTKKEELFYECGECDFWIHKTCAFLEPTIDRPNYHHHPLSLVFSLPEKLSNYRYTCKVCNKRVMQTEWTYHCSNCRYFIHIKCLPNPDQLPSTQRVEEIVEEESNNIEILHFPISHAFTDPLKLAHSGNDTSITGGGGDEERVEINHWSHDHPLFLTIVPQGTNNMPDPIITVCHCCVRPLSSSYYTCKHDGCSFTLHKYCAELSRTLQHQLHADHPLELVNTQSKVRCDACYKYCNAFIYKCSLCGFDLDVNCVFLPETIKHEFHKEHHLVQRAGHMWTRCTICQGKIDKRVGYFCESCNFRLDLHCAFRSPRSLPHRYCKGHQVSLTFPPIEDHPEDFFCEICEEEMNPLVPLYYCGKCKNSFHLKCLSRWYNYENYLKEGTLSVPDHKHPLTYVRRNKPPKEVCFGCNGDINGHLFLECRTGNCPYCLCLHCHPEDV